MSFIHINFNKIGRDIRKGFEHIPQEIAHIPDQLQKIGVDPHHVQDWIHHETQEVLFGVADEVAEISFHKIAEGARGVHEWLKNTHEASPDLIEDINKVGIGLGFSIVKFSYDNFYQRAEGLCQLLENQANDFRMTRSGVRNLLVNTGPTGISFNISGELFTSVASVSFDLYVPMSIAVKLVDFVLEKVGVPE